MATASSKTICVVCKKEKITYVCHGCSEQFCLEHLSEHRQNLDQQLDQIENDHDGLRENLNDLAKYPLIKQIDQWEIDSIDEIKQTADRCREKLINYTNGYILQTEKKLNHLAEQIEKMRHEKEFTEIDLNQLKQRLQKLQEELFRSANISIQQQSTSFISNISVLIPFHRNTRWKQFGMTIAGGKEQGNRLNQLSCPISLSVDKNDQTIYIADWGNDRIMEWRANATNGRVVAGGNGQGNEINQLNNPVEVVIDRENNSLIIADRGNNRVMRWSHQTSPHGQLIISDIHCCGLTMHKNGSLYVSDPERNEVKRWREGETNVTIVAGGNGQGIELNQLHHPTGIFVDDDHALYICDERNYRVMKWPKDAKEGIIVAGGNGKGDCVTQISSPAGVIVDQFGQIYVTDYAKDRVMRWCQGANEGTIVVGDNGDGQQANQLDGPIGLSFDREGNLYVVDHGNHRVQKFAID